ncbi:MAG: hypothetical protein WCK34_15240 [Bacteroidota bacterium]
MNELNSVSKYLGNDYQTIKRRFLWVISFFGMSLLLAVLVHFISRKEYKTQFVISPSSDETMIVEGTDKVTLYEMMKPEELERIVKNYSLLNKQYSPALIHDTLVLPANMANDLSSVASTQLRNTNVVEITLSVYHTQSIKPIALNLLKYINQNHFLSRNVNLERRKMRIIRDSLKSEILSMQVVLKGSQRDPSLCSKNGGTGIYKDLADLQARVADLDLKLTRMTGYEISVPPLVPKYPSNFSLSLLLVLFGFVGLVAGILAALIMDKLVVSARL